MLEKRILEKGLPLEPLQSYIDSFKHGVSPHAGAGIGLDRVVFLYLGKKGHLVASFQHIANVVFFCFRLGQRAKGIDVPQRPAQMHSLRNANIRKVSRVNDL